MNNIKDKIILLSWILGLLLIITLIWTLTQPLQTHYLLRSVNNTFINKGDSRRLLAHLPQGEMFSRSRRAGPFGYWYSMLDSENKMFVFAFFKDGISIPLGAVVSSTGAVEEIIPLSAHAVQIMDGLPKSILQMYTARIESAASISTGGKNR